MLDKLKELIRKDTEGCIEWPFGRHRSGHGIINIERKTLYTHRILYEITHQKDITGLIIRHTCDNPGCINPKHLLEGTHQDNVQDRVDRNRSALGENNGRSVLFEQDVLDIYKSTESNSILSRQYSVDGKTIRNIKQRRLWKYLLLEL